MMTVLKAILLTAGLAAAGVVAAMPASAQVAYTINGVPTTPDVTAYLQSQGLPYGHYWLMQNGNWGMVGSARVLGNIYAGTQHSPGTYGGSGEIYGNGSWSYYNDHVGGGGVGGDGNGCVYAYGWSNC